MASDDDKHARVTPAALGSAPIALRLPDELWLRIIAAFDYRRLRRIRRVCKRFERLVQDQRFDAKLFRRMPVGGELKPGKKVALHPLLEVVDCVRVQHDDAMIMPGFYKDPSVSRKELEDDPVDKTATSREDKDKDGADDDEAKGDGELKDWNGLDYPAAREYATSPACKALEVSMMGQYGFSRNESFVVRDASGVRCDKVLKAIAAYWCKPAPAGAANRARREWGWPKSRKVVKRDALGDHSFFEGWSKPVVQKDGSVYLEANPLGS